MWKLVEIANGRKSCDNPDLKSSDILAVLSVIEKYFEISYNKKGAIGLDTVGFDFQINEKHVTVGWDNWSGLFIMSREPDGDNVIERVFEFLVNDKGGGGILYRDKWIMRSNCLHGYNRLCGCVSIFNMI